MKFFDSFYVLGACFSVWFVLTLNIITFTDNRVLSLNILAIGLCLFLYWFLVLMDKEVE